MVVVMAVVRLAVMLRKNLFICILGGGYCGVGSGGGVNSGCCSPLVHHHNHYHHQTNTTFIIALLQLLQLHPY